MIARDLAINTIKFHGTIDVRWMKMTVRYQVTLHVSCVSVCWWFQIRYFASYVE